MRHKFKFSYLRSGKHLTLQEHTLNFGTGFNLELLAATQSKIDGHQHLIQHKSKETKYTYYTNFPRLSFSLCCVALKFPL
jgi:hypothetical protein